MNHEYTLPRSKIFNLVKISTYHLRKEYFSSYKAHRCDHQLLLDINLQVRKPWCDLFLLVAVDLIVLVWSVQHLLFYCRLISFLNTLTYFRLIHFHLFLRKCKYHFELNHLVFNYHYFAIIFSIELKQKPIEIMIPRQKEFLVRF